VLERERDEGQCAIVATAAEDGKEEHGDAEEGGYDDGEVDEAALPSHHREP
jgi:hypothetical protein